MRAVVGASVRSFAADQAPTWSSVRSRSLHEPIGRALLSVEASMCRRTMRSYRSRVEGAQRPFCPVPRSSHACAASETVRLVRSTWPPASLMVSTSARASATPARESRSRRATAMPSSWPARIRSMSASSPRRESTLPLLSMSSNHSATSTPRSFAHVRMMSRCCSGDWKLSPSRPMRRRPEHSLLDG
jgi:hypothetical protein